MKQIKKYLTMKWCAIISALLGVLGFAATGCNKETYGPDLYGQPYAKFKIDGAVLNEGGVAMKDVNIYVRGHYGDTTKTDQNGKYVFDAQDILPYSELWVMAEDPSGIYAADSVKVTPNFEGGDRDWYSGSYSTTHDFTLKKKPTQPEPPELPTNHEE